MAGPSEGCKRGGFKCEPNINWCKARAVFVANIQVSPYCNGAVWRGQGLRGLPAGVEERLRLQWKEPVL